MCNIIKFIENNTSLINEYESLENAISLDYCSDEITNIYNRMVKVDKTVNFNNVLSNAIKQSIKYNTSVLDSMETIFNEMCLGDQSLGTTQIYFKEINDIYTRNNNNFDIEYCEENKDKLLSMNLKTVISIAKNYQGMGLTLPELISAGNLGLSLAWDKFDPNRAKLKNNMLDAVNDLDEDVTFNELYNSIQPFLEYGLKSFSPGKTSIGVNFLYRSVRTTIFRSPVCRSYFPMAMSMRLMAFRSSGRSATVSPLGWIFSPMIPA